MVPLTQQAQEIVRRRLTSGDAAIDATAGNGYDTLFLAQCVGQNGQVYAIDLQATALAATRARLASKQCLDRVTLIEGDHARLDLLLPVSVHGRVTAIMFNLGYLPGGDRQQVTRRESTLAALDGAISLLRPDGGVMTVVAYPGHPGGAEEAAAVREWFASLDPARYRTGAVFEPNRHHPPELHFLETVPNQ